MSKLMDPIGRIAVASYAGAVYFSSLLLLFFVAALAQTMAAVAALAPFIAACLYAALCPLIWRGSPRAMLGTFAVSVVVALFVASLSPHIVAVPHIMAYGSVLFLLLTGLAMRAGPRSRNAEDRGNMVAGVYAILAYLYGFAVVVLWPMSIDAVETWRDRWVQWGWWYSFPVLILALYVVILGFMIGALSIPIWRGRLWGMVLAFALVLAHWLALATLVASFWTNPWYAAAPVVAAILTVLFLVTGVRATGMAQQP